MPDTLRIKSTLPVSIRIAEPHPDPEKPGNSPELRQAVIRPGVNDGVDADLFRVWAEVSPNFIASADDVKAGNTEGRVYEMAEDEPDVEYGFEPALKRAVDAGGEDAAKGSTLTDPGPVKAEDMRTGSTDAPPAAPVLTASAPLKTPVTADPTIGGVAAKLAEHGEPQTGFAAVTPPLPSNEGDHG